MPDDWEVAHSVSDPAADPDGDKVSNADEYTNDTDPQSDLDGDADGMPDDWEVAHSVSDPAADPDGDGVLNSDEFLNGTDPVNNLDSDGDGMSDDWEILYGLDSADNQDALVDSDGDGYLNIYEYHRGQSNPANPASVPVANIYVSQTGEHIAPYNTPENAAVNIGDALNGSTDDYDIIEVADGTYTGAGNVNLIFPSHPVILRSANGAENCIIDCQNIAETRAIQFSGGQDERSVLQGITIRNGNYNGSSYLYGGGGISCGSISVSASPTIRDCVIENCTANYGGGIYYYSSPNSLLENCIIRGNGTPGAGGGVYARLSEGLNIVGGSIVGNTAELSGGGICYYSSPNAQLEGSLILGNTTLTGDGGGVYVDQSAGLNIVGGWLIGNTAELNGGGIYYIGSPNSQLENCVIKGNSTLTENGGGVYVSASAGLNIVGGLIDDNTASANGGGVYVSHGDAVNISGCSISENIAQMSAGGIYLYRSSNAVLENNVISQNQALNSTAGGLRLSVAARTVVENCVVAQNSAADNGGGVYVRSSDESQFVNCTVVDNTASSTGGGLYLYDDHVRVTNSILWANSPDQIEIYSGSHTVSYSCVQGGIAGIGNIIDNPAFDADGWHLTSGSPCLDAGINAGAPTVDIEGQNRMDLSAVANRISPTDFVDIGADEYADSDNDGLSDEWELLYFGSPTDAVPTDDEDLDNLNNLEEFLAGTNPLYPDGILDTDGDHIGNNVDPDDDNDAVNDDVELRYGRDSLVIDTYPVTWPLTENFETRSLGNIDGQSGWGVSSGTATVQGGVVHNGSQALYIEDPASLHHLSKTSDTQQVWVDMYVKPVGSAAPISSLGEVRMYVDAAGALQVQNGINGVWSALPNVTLDPNAWQRLTLLIDYHNQEWRIWINGSLVSAKLSFAETVNQFNSLPLPMSEGYIDDITVGAEMPDGIEAFGGEIIYTGPQAGAVKILLTTDENEWACANADYLTELGGPGFYVFPPLDGGSYYLKAFIDTDGDGAWTELIGEARGKNAVVITQTTGLNFDLTLTVSDLDNDGMSDEWEDLNGFNPLSDADGGSANEDGDGLTNVEEFERGTDPNDSNSTSVGVLVVMPDADQYQANEPDLSWTDLPDLP